MRGARSIAGPAAARVTRGGRVGAGDAMQGGAISAHGATARVVVAVPSPGIAAAPGGVVLESEADIAREAWSIYLHAGLSDAMPPATVSFMDEAERAQIRRWYRHASGG